MEAGRKRINMETKNAWLKYTGEKKAEVFDFAEGYRKRSSDKSELLKHLRKVWNFLFYDSPLKLDA